MSGTTGVEDTLKDFWATRPRRPRRGRKLAGVAAGIGNRYGIDPVIVRVGFVVATFYGGAGVLMYLLGWLLLPEQDDEAAPFESMVKRRRGSTSAAFTVLLCLALIPAFGFLVVDNQFSGLLGLLLVAGVLYLLHRSRGHLNRPPDAPAAGPSFAAPAQPTAQYTTPFATPATEPAQGETPRTTPPAWDPLGAAPFAWDLPEPSPPAPEPPQPRRRSRVGLLTVGATLVVAGTLALVAPYVGGWLTPQHIIGISLAVIGLGMVGGAFAGGGRGLIGLAAPLAVVGVAFTTISPQGWHGVGEINERPTSIEQVRSSYQFSAGRIFLDLTALPPSGEVDTHVELDVGDVTVIVPSTADVDVTCQANLGDVLCLGRTADGTDADLEFMDHGTDGPGGLQVNLHAEAGAGRVEVRRG